MDRLGTWFDRQPTSALRWLIAVPLVVAVVIAVL